MRRTSWLFTGCLVAGFGCSDQPEVLVDSSGARFGWECSKRGGCELTVLPETPEPLGCPDGYDAGYSYVWGRFIEIHSVCASPEFSGWFGSGARGGRFLVCSNDGDCPQLDFKQTPAHYECRAGVCQNVDTNKYPPEWVTLPMAELLCVADLPRADWTSTELMALANEHCDDADQPYPCELPLPDPCWQPL